MSDQESEINPASPEGESTEQLLQLEWQRPRRPAPAAPTRASSRPDRSSWPTWPRRCRRPRRRAGAQRRGDRAAPQGAPRRDPRPRRRSRPRTSASSPRKMSRASTPGPTARSSASSSSGAPDRLASRAAPDPARGAPQVVAREVEAVEAAVADYRVEIERFFARLGSQTDPVEIARQAGTRPGIPGTEQIGPAGRTSAVAAATRDGLRAACRHASGYHVTMYSSDAAAPPVEEAVPGGTERTEPPPGPRRHSRRADEGAPQRREVAESGPGRVVMRARALGSPTEPASRRAPDRRDDQPARAKGADDPLVGVMDPDVQSADRAPAGPDSYVPDTEARGRAGSSGASARQATLTTVGRRAGRGLERARRRGFRRARPGGGRRASSCPAARRRLMAPLAERLGRPIRPGPAADEPAAVADGVTADVRVDSILALIPGIPGRAPHRGRGRGRAHHLPVVVVDDGSTDDTAAQAEAAGATVLARPERGQRRGPAGRLSVRAGA